MGSFDVRYKPRDAIKGQVLADFVAKFTLVVGDAHEVYQVSVHGMCMWTGVSNAQGSGIGIVLESPEGMKIEHLLRPGFHASNNEAEYETLVARLRAVLEIGATYVEVYSNSCLVVSEVKGSFEARDLRMVDYLKPVCSLQVHFKPVKVAQISRG